MASDLSKLIQDSFTLTLNGLLAKDAKILEITKAHIKDVENLQLLKVQSSFEFTNFTSQLSFILPAKSCSLIFNTMMGASIEELSDEIDDDAEDAIGEFVSNTSGTLTTSINGENFEDIGQAKFNIASKETIQSDTITNIENLYKYQIDLEESELVIFILFDELLLPYIEDTAASEVTHHEEVIEEVEEEIIEEIEETTQEVQKIDEPIEKSTNVEKTKITQKIKKAKLPDDKKKRITIILGAALGFIFILLLLMFFIGIFDEEIIEEKTEDTKTTKAIDPNKINVIKYDTKKKVNFKHSDINKERLNTKLLELTKFKVLSTDELEAQKLAEKNRLFELEKEKKLIKFSKNNHEEPLIIQKKDSLAKTVENKNIDITDSDTNQTKTEEKTRLISNGIEEKEEIIPEIAKTLHYTVTNSFKYGLFKSLVQATNTKQARISICNNDTGKTTIYIGPFETKELQEKMIQLIQDNNIEIKAENLTEEDFNTRCNLE